MDGDKRFKRKTIPVEVGEKLNLKIENIGDKGDGIAKVDGFVVIIAKPVDVGITYPITISRVLQRVAFGEVDEPKMLDDGEEEDEDNEKI